MPSQSPQPPAEGSAAAARQRSPDERATATERCGPVKVERYRKDDGRSLILYVREPGPQA